MQVSEDTHEFARAVARRWFPNAVVEHIRPLAGGVSATVALLQVRRSNGEQARLVVRRPELAPGAESEQSTARREYLLLRALHEMALPVPRPLLLSDAQHDRLAPYFVMEYIEGSPEVAPVDRPAVLARMANFLADLHQLDLDRARLPALPDREDVVTDVLQYLEDDELSAAIGLYGQSAGLRDVPVRLLHGDYWPNNLLWRGTELVAVVDWEDAAIGDPLSDLAAARVELLCAYGSEAARTFTERYLARVDFEIDRRRLALWEVYVSASALRFMGEWGLDPADEAHRRRRTEQFLAGARADFLDSTGGVNYSP